MHSSRADSPTAQLPVSSVNWQQWLQLAGGSKYVGQVGQFQRLMELAAQMRWCGATFYFNWFLLNTKISLVTNYTCMFLPPRSFCWYITVWQPKSLSFIAICNALAICDIIAVLCTVNNVSQGAAW